MCKNKGTMYNFFGGRGLHHHCHIIDDVFFLPIRTYVYMNKIHVYR